MVGNGLHAPSLLGSTSEGFLKPSGLIGFLLSGEMAPLCHKVSGPQIPQILLTFKESGVLRREGASQRGLAV